MNDLIVSSRYTDYPEPIKKALEDAGIEGLRIGDTFASEGSYYSGFGVRKIIRIEQETRNHNVAEYTYNKVVYIKMKDWDGTTWDTTEHYDSFSDFKYYTNGAKKLDPDKSPASYLQEALDLISGKTSLDLYRAAEHRDDEQEQGLVHTRSKEALIVMQQGLEAKREHALTVAEFVKIEMVRRKQELEKIREGMYEVVAQFHKQINKIMRVITTIELYLGIGEELFQIQDGPKAPQPTPISFRQQVLYMDEEIGHWENGGLDYSNIGWFDTWLVENNNFKRLLPEEKGLLVFRPRRFKKEYEGDGLGAAIENAAKNAANMNNTYLLIRNGECLYRVFSEKIVILPRLFPKRQELQELLEKIEKQQERYIKSNEAKKEIIQEDMDKATYKYKNRALLMQGLIDRTEVFHPLPAEKVNIFKLDELGDKVNFIYDDEATLPSGRLPFSEWLKKINASINTGSRIVYALHIDGNRRSDYRKRFQRSYSEYSTPKLPGTGVYQVEEIKAEKGLRLTESGFELAKAYWEKKGWSYKHFRYVGKEDHKFTANYNGWNSDEHWFTNEPFILTKDEREIYVEGFIMKKVISYNPGGTTYAGWGDWEGRDRKNNLNFEIHIAEDGRCIMNYDQISLEDIEFYLTSRVDRPNYLEMMPLLLSMKAWRLKELEQETEFVRFVVGRNKDKFTFSERKLEARVWDAVDWWKHKNKWKRAIEKDDTLALRMIEKHISNKDYKYFNGQD